MSSRWWGAVKLWRMLVGSLDDENEKNAAAERPATAAKTPLGIAAVLQPGSCNCGSGLVFFFFFRVLVLISVKTGLYLGP